MDEDTYIEIEEQLTEELGRKPTEEEIESEFASQCDWAYEQMKDDLDGDGDY